MGMAYLNMAAMVFEVTLPKMRSTAIAWMMVFQFTGGLIGPLADQALSGRIGLQPEMVWVMASALGLALVLLTALFFLLPGEIDPGRGHLAFCRKLEPRLESQEQ